RLKGESGDGYLKAPKTRFNRTLSPGRSIAFADVDVELVKAIKTAYGVTFNDVVVAAVAGGLRRRLLDENELPSTPLLAFVPPRARTPAASITPPTPPSTAPVPPPPGGRFARARAAHAGMPAVKPPHETAPPPLLEDANALIFPPVFGQIAAGVMR